MRQFMDDNFLMENETAISLYHNVANRYPIVDYHCNPSMQTLYSLKSNIYNMIDNIIKLSVLVEYRACLSSLTGFASP